MRYLGLPKFPYKLDPFTILNIYEMREPEKKNILVELPITGTDKFDEIASRREVYGENGEALSYKIVDANMVKLFDAEFDLNLLSSVGITV